MFVKSTTADESFSLDKKSNYLQPQSMILTFQTQAWIMHGTHHLYRVDVYGMLFENPLKHKKIMARQGPSDL